MSRVPRYRALARVVLAWMLALGFSLASAEVIFDDHFDGNSGGMPANWIGDGDGSVVEAGSVVTLHDEFGIATVADLDPNQSPATTIATAIDGTSNHSHCGIIDFSQFDNHFWVKLWAEDGRIEVKASDVDNGEEEFVVGQVAGYAGGPIVLTIVLEPETFQISTDAPAFSSGPIAYASVFTSFTRADLGHAAKLVLESECSPVGPPCSSSYDRITMEIGPPSPLASLSWSMIRAPYRR